MHSRWRLDGMRALVTGGTKGIGLAITKEFLDLGAEVAVVSRKDAGAGNPLATAAQTGRLHTVRADVSNADGRARVLDGLPASWGTLDILVNNVGTNIRKPSLTISDAEFRTVFETNLTSAWDLSRALQPRLAASGHASLVNIGSVAGMRSVGSGAAYANRPARRCASTRCPGPGSGTRRRHTSAQRSATSICWWASCGPRPATATCTARTGHGCPSCPPSCPSSRSRHQPAGTGCTRPV